MREREQRLAADLAGRMGLTNEESQRLLAQHQQELQSLEQKLDVERLRSQEAIKQKLLSRKKQKEEQLRKRQDAEICREQLEQDREMADLVSDQLKEAERAAIVTGLQQNRTGQADEVVRLVLAQRHAREQEDLEQRAGKERTAAVNDALASLLEKQQAQRDRLEALHQEELAELLDGVDALSPDELDDMRTQMLDRHHAELRDLAGQEEEERARLEKDTWASLDIKFALARLQLTEQQYQEVSDALRDLGPETMAANSTQAAAAAAELERVRIRLEEQRAAEEARLAAEREALEQAEQARLTAELAALDRQLEEQRLRDQEQSSKEIEALERKKAEMIKAGRAKLQQGITSRGAVSDDEKNAILKQFEVDEQRLCNTLDAEKIRQTTALEVRLMQKRERRRVIKEKELRAATAAASAPAAISNADLAQTLHQAAALTLVAASKQRRASAMIDQRRRSSFSAFGRPSTSMTSPVPALLSEATVMSVQTIQQQLQQQPLQEEEMFR